MIDQKKETGYLRVQWTYFKKGKNEINFLMNVYQTIILLLSMSFIGSLPVETLITITLLFVLLFVIMANRLGKYSVAHVEPSGFYISPYHQDLQHFRVGLLGAMRDYNQGFTKLGDEKIERTIEIMEKWIRLEEA